MNTSVIHIWCFSCYMYVRDRYITEENKIDACIEGDTGTRNFKADGINTSAVESELEKKQCAEFFAGSLFSCTVNTLL